MAPPAVGLLDVAERSAERALLAGMRATRTRSTRRPRSAAGRAVGNLVSPRDRAAAHKLLAFIFCTSNRMTDCEVQFRAARAADPGFALSAEPATRWGPVYQRGSSSDNPGLARTDTPSSAPSRQFRHTPRVYWEDTDAGGVVFTRTT